MKEGFIGKIFKAIINPVIKVIQDATKPLLEKLIKIAVEVFVGRLNMIVDMVIIPMVDMVTMAIITIFNNKALMNTINKVIDLTVDLGLKIGYIII